jgi:hypothetical protein
LSEKRHFLANFILKIITSAPGLDARHWTSLRRRCPQDDEAGDDSMKPLRLVNQLDLDNLISYECCLELIEFETA